MALWTREEIETLPRSYPGSAFLVLYAGNRPAAAALLTDNDALFWPDAPPGSSGFLHKLSVRREFAGSGISWRLIEYAAELYRREGKTHLRLDCDASREKLKRLYVSAGFCYIGDRTAQTKTHGTLAVSLFERAL